MRRAGVLWLVLFAASAATVGLRAGPGEDLTAPEARVLLAAESIVSDRDLDLRDEFRGAAWRPFFGGDLAPVAVPRGGRVREPRAIGFALLVAPAYAVGGRVAVELFLAAVAALGFVAAAALGRRLVPEPWPTRAALVTGLSPPVLVASTTIAPDAAGATILAAAAILALRVRERPRARTALAAGGLLALLPWLAVRLLAPGAVVAAALVRWPRRRQRALAGVAGLEALLFSLVLYVSIDDRLFGGLTPDAVLPAGSSATGASGVGEHLARWPRLVTVWVDPHAGLLCWAPFYGLCFVAGWLLWRSRRERLAVALPGQIDVEVAAGLLVATSLAGVLVAVFALPDLGGPWFAGHGVVPVLPLLAALCAWGWRRVPRTGAALAALTLALSVALVVVVRTDGDAGVAPPRGPLAYAGSGPPASATTTPAAPAASSVATTPRPRTSSATAAPASTRPCQRSCSAPASGTAAPRIAPTAAAPAPSRNARARTSARRRSKRRAPASTKTNEGAKATAAASRPPPIPAAA